MKQNLHTHTVYCDGRDTPAEMAEEAIRLGFDSLGFSGHGRLSIDQAAMTPEAQEAYIKDIQQLQQCIQDRLKIYLGLEQDVRGRCPEKKPFACIIGSVHFLEADGVILPLDHSPEIFLRILNELYHGDPSALAKAYYAEVAQMADWDEVDIIGHLDLITKFKERIPGLSFGDPVSIQAALNCIDALAPCKLFEVNTGAIARGYRHEPYPSEKLLRYMHERDARLVLSSDCHDRRYLDCFFPEALDIIRRCGFRSLYVLGDNGFEEHDISEFD